MQMDYLNVSKRLQHKNLDINVAIRNWSLLKLLIIRAMYNSFDLDCGVRPMAPEARIVGGRRSDYGRWPWQVLIRESTWFGIFSKNKCGGVLISDRHVLTAAHCQPG